MSRNSQKSSVSMEIDGQTVIVEVTPTEAINIMELLN
jgi:tRNA threonylcarbamoyladenosine modification (KEOPS) complex  Pcc1 subunit